MLSSISAVDRCSRAAVRAFSMARSALAGANTIHALESKQIPGGINHCDCRGRLALLRALPCHLQHRLGSGLIKDHQVDGLRPGCKAEDRCQHSNANSKFRHCELIPLKFSGTRMLSRTACVTVSTKCLWCEPGSPRSLWRRQG